MTQTAERPETEQESPSKTRLVVVGNGMSGARALEEILARGGGDTFAIEVFGDEPYGNYNRILLSEVLANAAGRAVDNEDADGEDELYLNPLDWYDENGITLHAGVRIVRIDRHAKVVYGDDGSVTPYDTLVLATGSRSFFPPMEGMWASKTELTPGVFGFRSLDDATGMLAHITEHRTAVVIGGGLLGLEAAAGLQAHGVAVHVVHPTEVLMNQQLEAEASKVLRSKLEDMGMHLHLGVKTNEILTEHGRVSGVRFTDGSDLACDMVVVTAGIRPNIGLAMVSGLETQRAIVVDDKLRSVDDDSIFVVGECAQHRGEVYGVVGPLWEQAAVLADVVTGADPDAEYHGSRLATKLKVAGVDVAQMGVKVPERSSDEFVQFSETGRGVYQTVVIRDGTLIGATLVGDVSKVAALTQAFDSRSALPEERIKLLFDLGSAADAASAADLPADTQICHCNGVSKGDLVACVHDGAESVSACMAATRAGKGCGSCKGLVTDVVEAALGRRGRGGPGRQLLRPGHPPGQADAHGRDPVPGPEVRLERVRRARPGRQGPRRLEDGAHRAAADDVARRPRRRARRPVHQRPGARQHPARRHVLGRAAHVRRRHEPRPAAPHRRRRRQARDPDGEADRRPAHRPARRPEGEAAGGLGRPRHALGLGVRQELPDGEDLRRHRLLPVRAGRLHAARDRHGGALQGRRGAGEDEARRLRVPAQLRRVDGEGRRSGGHRKADCSGRSTSAARPGRRSARATSSPPSTPTTRRCGSPAGSCSTTGRTPTGSSAPTTSCRAWASTT